MVNFALLWGTVGILGKYFGEYTEPGILYFIHFPDDATVCMQNPITTNLNDSIKI